MHEPLTTTLELTEDTTNTSLRPLSLDDFTGQPLLKDNLRVFIEAARQREEVMDHTLFLAPGAG